MSLDEKRLAELNNIFNSLGTGKKVQEGPYLTEPNMAKEFPEQFKDHTTAAENTLDLTGTNQYEGYDFSGGLLEQAPQTNYGYGGDFGPSFVDKATAELNAYKKYYMSDEQRLIEAQEINKATGIPVSDIIRDKESFANALEIMEHKKKGFDYEEMFATNPALAKLGQYGNDTMAAIAMNHLQEVEDQKNIIDYSINQARADSIRVEFRNIAKQEVVFGKQIDWRHVKELQEEYRRVSQLPDFMDAPLTNIIAGGIGQAPQTYRGLLQGAKRGAQGVAAVYGAGYGLNFLKSVGGNNVLETPLAPAKFLMSRKAAEGAWNIGMRTGNFEQVFDEEFGAKYLEYRTEQTKDGKLIYSENEARVYAAVNAALSAGIETANTGHVLDFMRGTKGAAADSVRDIIRNASSKESLQAALKNVLTRGGWRDGGRFVVEEALLEEPLDSFASDVVKNVSTVFNPDAEGVSAKQMLVNAGTAGVQAIPSVVGLGVINKGVGYAGTRTFKAFTGIDLSKRVEDYKTKAAQNNAHTQNGVNMVEQLKASKEASELAKKSPETYNEVLKHNLAGSGFEEVTIDVQELKKNKGDEQAEAIVRQAAQELNLSEETTNAILAGENDLNVPTETYMQMDIFKAENINDFITFSEGATCFAKNQRMAKQAKVALDNLMASEKKDIEELKEIIINNSFEEQDREAARAIIDEFGMQPQSDLKRILNETSQQIVKLLNDYSPQSRSVETDGSNSYYIEGKGYGYYTDRDNNYVEEGYLGSDIKTETKDWTWHAVQSTENLPWYERYLASDEGPLFADKRTSPKKRALTREAIMGNDRFGIFEGATPEDIKEVRERLQKLEDKAAQAQRLLEGFGKFESNEDQVARGLSKEGYQVYRMALEALKKAPEGAREAAQFDAILLARHADRFADIMRAAGNENFTALDYIEQYVRIDPEGKSGKEGGLLQRAWHGSPFRFGKFDLGAIGTGEGRQAHGWGLYFADDREVAENYKDVLSDDLGSAAVRSLYEVEIPSIDDMLLEFETVIYQQEGRIYEAAKKIVPEEYWGRFEHMDGRDLYKLLKKIYGSAREASMALNSVGVKGIFYEGLRDGDCYVVFDDKAIEIINTFNQNANGQISFTKEQKAIISLFQTANKSTFVHEMGHLFLRDLEMLSMLRDDNLKMPEQIMKDYKTVLAWAEWNDKQINEYKGTAVYEEFKARDAAIKQAIKDGNIDEADRLKGIWLQERFARGFEQYLKEGKAPAAGLKRIYRMFKQWLCSIYKDAVQVGVAPSPEVKAVMDRMLATEEEIELQAQRSSFNSFINAGGLNFLAKNEQELYEKYLEEAKEEAKERVLKLAMKEVSDNYAKERQERLEDIKAAIEEEAEEIDVFAIADMETVDASSLAESLRLANITEEEYRKQLAELGGSREAYIKSRLEFATLDLDNSPVTIENIKAEAQNAIDSGEYADKLFELEMQALQEKAAIEARVGKIVDRKIAKLKKVLDEATKETDKEEGPSYIEQLEQTINDLRYTIRWNKAETDLLLKIQAGLAKHKAELKAIEADEKLKDLRETKNAKIKEVREKYKADLEKSIQQFNDYRAKTREGLRLVRDANKGAISETRKYLKGWSWNLSEKLSETTKETFWRRKAEEHSRECAEYLAKQDYENAAIEKQDEARAAIMANICKQNQKYVEKVVDSLKKKAKTMKKINNLSANNRFLYNTLMYSFGLAKEPPEMPPSWIGIEPFIQELREKGYDVTFSSNDGIGIETSIIPSWLERGMNGELTSKGVLSLSVLELRDLYNFMKMLYKSGREEKIRDKNGKLIEVGRAAEVIANDIADRLYSISDGKPKVNQDVSTIQKLLRLAREGNMDILTVETVCRMMGDNAMNFIYDRINDAAMNKLVMQKEMVSKLKTLFSETINGSREFLNKTYMFNGEAISGKQLLSLALNWGNETNRMRVMDGFNVTEDQVNEVLQNLTAKEWAFVEGVWGLFNELWPQVQAVQYRRTGGSARTEAALPFTIVDKNGVAHDVKGGYYPIAFDKNQSMRAMQMFTDSNARMGAGTTSQLGANMGSTKERAKKVTGMPLDTRLELIASRLEQQINIITMKEAIDDVNMLFRNVDFQNAVINTWGVDMMRRLQQWLGDQWAPKVREQNFLTKSFRFFRTNATMSTLGARLSTTVTNFANFLNVMHYVGPINAFAAMYNYYSHPNENREFIKKNSPFIRERISTKDRDIRDALSEGIDFDGNNVTSKIKDYSAKLKELAFIPIRETDFMMALPLWKYEYERACKEADTTKLTAEQIHKEGVRAGDAAVRRMIGSGMQHDLNKFQTGSEFEKLFTMYYSYFVVVYNATAYSIFEGRKNYKQTGDWKKAAAPMASGIFYMILAQAIADAAIREAFNLLGDKDDPYERLIKKSGANIVDNAAGGIPFVRDVVPYLIDVATGEREGDFRLPAWTFIQQFGKVARTAKSNKKDEYDLARESLKIVGQSTGLSQTALDAIPTTIEFMNNADKYDLWDYIKATSRDKRLGK